MTQNFEPIELLQPIPGLPGSDGIPKDITRIVLRHPTHREFEQIGDIESVVGTKGGTMYVTDSEGAFARYFELLLVEPALPALARNISLTDSMRVKAMLVDFFRDCRAAAAAKSITLS